MYRAFFGFAFVPLLALTACADANPPPVAEKQPNEIVVETAVEPRWVACDEMLARSSAEFMRLVGVHLPGDSTTVVCWHDIKSGSASKLLILLINGTRNFASLTGIQSDIERLFPDASTEMTVSLEELMFRPWPTVREECAPECDPAFIEPVYYLKRRHDDTDHVEQVVFTGFNLNRGSDYFFAVPIILTHFTEVTDELVEAKFNTALRSISFDYWPKSTNTVRTF